MFSLLKWDIFGFLVMTFFNSPVYTGKCSTFAKTTQHVAFFVKIKILETSALNILLSCISALEIEIDIYFPFGST